MNKPIQPCIWCGSLTHGSLEHILPEALGCPSDFILTEGVCISCNNGLGHVDQALVHEFELIACLAGVPRKSGPPGIHSWAAVAATTTASGPEWHLNAGPQPIPALNKKLAAAKPSNGISNVAMSVKDGVGTITFDQTFGADPKFVRAVYKTALGSLAFFEGLAAARHEKFDPIRTFVRSGKGKFRVLMMERQDGRRTFFGPPWAGPESTHPVVGMTILGVSLIADLDPEQKGLTHISNTAPKEERLMVIPPT
jgi:HNH endonuclease